MYGISLQKYFKKSMKPIQTAVALITLTSALEIGGGVSAFGYAPSTVRETFPWPQNRPILSSDTLFEEGVKKQEQEDYRGAIVAYTEFLKANPDFAEAYNNRGFSKAMLKDLQGALQDFDRAISLAPTSADAYNARGNVNAMAGNLSASIGDFNHAIRYNRNFADAYYNRGISRHGLGDRNGAKSDLGRAAKLFQQQQDLGGYQQAQEWMDKLK
jgi:tetratricopeptide (TPR) repeat protein